MDSELELSVGMAKVGKFAAGESGDTLELIERPKGGISFVLVDGQRSGRGAKRVSSLVARKAISLLSEGVRDGAAARAAHDYLHAERQGKVSAELVIVSLDLVTKSLVISRNSHCPVLVLDREGTRWLNEPSAPIGIYEWTKPVIAELPLQEGMWVVIFTDGILEAGRYSGHVLDVEPLVVQHTVQPTASAATLADTLLDQAMALDQGRPEDDMSVLVLRLAARPQTLLVRRLAVSFPLPYL